MIVFNRRPFIIQNFPIVSWTEVVPERAKQLHVRVDLDLLHDKADGAKIMRLMEAVRDLMEGATFRDTGNEVLPKKLANLITQDGREAVVPAESVPRGMLIGKEQEDGQRQQPKRVQQEEGACVCKDSPTGLRHINTKVVLTEDSVRDEGREVGAETAEGSPDPSDPSDA